MKIVDLKLILLLQVIYQLRNVGSSYYEDRGTSDQESQSQEMNSSGSEQRHSHHHHHARRSGHRHKKTHDHDHDHEHDHEHTPIMRYGGHRDSNESEDCDCDCSKCEQPSNCCKNMCKTCPDPRAGQSQSSLVFVPYPYPMIVPSIMKNPHDPNNNNDTPRPYPDPPTTPAQTTTESTTTTTTTTTTTSSTTTSTEPPTQRVYLKSQNDNNMLDTVLKSVVDDYSNIIVKTPDKLKNGNSKYMLTSLRRTKPTWMPKFGIVPISDNIAEKLMSQLRGVKGLTRRQRQKRYANYYEKF